MNKVLLTGRLTRDPEIRYSGETAVARFTLAVNRKFVKDNSDQKADFINCIAFGKTGEFVEKYFSKGKKADLSGRIQTGSYTNKDGNKVYTTDVVVEDIEFGESKASAHANGAPVENKTNPAPMDDDFMNVPDGIADELPFA